MLIPGPNLPLHLCVCLKGGETEEQWGKLLTARPAAFITLPSCTWVLYENFFRMCVGREKNPASHQNVNQRGTIHLCIFPV